MHISDIENMNKLKVNMVLKHKGNWQDGSKRWGRRTQFMYALRRHLTDLQIVYLTPAQHKIETSSSTTSSSQQQPQQMQAAPMTTLSVPTFTMSEPAAERAVAAAAQQSLAGGMHM
ncbi:uncharacterized protein EV422DRAFT_104728 [Fimicolochytrium jonesii]|uniref:uncharacterized protein n=1 Tax=Fimicolochytrium jonesii TaxID=1396493 RepID=UPI0022FE4213|nr:uncharacterized protein EV422DRAFT_104728 [Fimicolochytrium jonesii]KAI8819730.1 hypothetical protein EV422DRAFT_104728 [Fimicolochytrium jonesii]